MYNDLRGFVSKIENPALMCDENGDIIILNNRMKKIFKFVDIRSPNTIKDLDDTFLNNDYYSNNSKIIRLRDLNINVDVYTLRDYKNNINFVYLFEKSMITDGVVQNLIEHIDEVVVIFNKDGVIEMMNSLCDEVLPFNRREVLGRSIHKLVSNGIVEDPIIINMLNDKKKTYKNIVYPGGKVIAYTALPIFGSKDEIKGGVLTGRDISRVINLEYQNKLNSNKVDIEYISKSKIMDNIKKIVVRAAHSDSSIFITGESGVGKEIIAREICKNSSRSDKAFIAINCGAIPNELLESEFFGYEEGSFTGAKRKGKKGIFEQANGGTIFLDEIGELPMQMQKKLLRVVQENTFTRIGGIKPIKVDIRYVSATNIPYEDLHNNNKFRQDLYYRLSVIPIKIPSLRERKEDIEPLVEYFIKSYNTKYSRNIKISDKVMNLMYEYSWPGNIRELKNIIERFVVLSVKDVIGEDEYNIMKNLESVEKTGKEKNVIMINEIIDLHEAHRLVDQILISRAIDKYGSIKKAAKKIGVDSSTIHRKIKSGFINI